MFYLKLKESEEACKKAGAGEGNSAIFVQINTNLPKWFIWVLNKCGMKINPQIIPGYFDENNQFKANQEMKNAESSPQA